MVIPGVNKKKDEKDQKEAKQEFLKPALVQQLRDNDWLNQNGSFNFKKIKANAGNHLVFSLEVDGLSFHVKVFPEFPAIEWSVAALQSLITGTSLPLALVYWTVHVSGKVVEQYPVLLTKTVLGKTLQQALVETPTLTQRLDPYAYGLATVMAILTNPGDGNPNNFIVQETKTDYCLVPIDQDRAFIRHAQGQKIGVQTILYTLDLMDTRIHDAVRKRLLILSPFALLEQWLDRVASFQESICACFGKQVEAFYEQSAWQAFQNPFQKTLALSLFKSGTVIGLFEKLQLLQDLLEKKPEIRYFELLAGIYPGLASHYQQKFSEATNPLKRFELASEGAYQALSTQGGRYYSSVYRSQEMLASICDAVPTAENLSIAWKHTMKTAHQELCDLSVREECRLFLMPAVPEDHIVIKDAVYLYNDQDKLYYKVKVRNKIKQDEITLGKEIGGGVTTAFFKSLKKLISSSSSLVEIKEEDIKAKVLTITSRRGHTYREGQLKKAIDALKEGKPKRFHDLPIDKSKEKAVNQLLDFTGLTNAAQEAILKKLIKVPFQHLKLKDCKALTDEQLGALVKASPNLQRLSLRNCAAITGNSIDRLRQCPELQRLKLEHLAQLKSLIGVPGRFQNKSFPALAQLEIAHCPISECRLQAEELEQLYLSNIATSMELHLQAPRLKIMSLKQCPNLKPVGVQAGVASALSLQTIMMRECPYLGPVASAWEQYPFLIHAPLGLLEALEACLDQSLRAHGCTWKTLSIRAQQTLAQCTIDGWKQQRAIMTPFLPVLLKLCQQDRYVRAVAVKALSKVGPWMAPEQQPAIVKTLMGLCRDEDWVVRRMVIRALKKLSQWASPDQRSLILKTLQMHQDPDDYVQQATKRALEKMEQQATKPSLTMKTLKVLEPELIPSQLITQLTDEKPAVQVKALQSCMVLPRLGLQSSLEAALLTLRIPQVFTPGYQKKAKIVPQVNPQTLSKFLELVAAGEQDQAEALLKEDRNLALVAGNVTDPGGRTFNHITGFQYAVWALDWHMWRMIRKYLSNEAAAEQTKGMETGSWVQQHGEMASWQTLIEALQTYINKFDEWDWDQRNHYWVKVIGGLQRRLPMHVLHEYCHPKRSFHPPPDFTTHEPPLIRKLSKGLVLVEFGDTYAIWRSNWPGGVGWMWCSIAPANPSTVVDHDWCALAYLFSERTQQRGMLMAELANSFKLTIGK